MQGTILFSKNWTADFLNLDSLQNEGWECLVTSYSTARYRGASAANETSTTQLQTTPHPHCVQENGFDSNPLKCVLVLQEKKLNDTQNY